MDSCARHDIPLNHDALSDSLGCANLYLHSEEKCVFDPLPGMSLARLRLQLDAASLSIRRAKVFNQPDINLQLDER